MELLDQLDLFDELAQTGFVGKRNATFKDGQRVQGRGWAGLENIQGTYFDFFFNIRLKYSEDVFRGRLKKLGVEVQAPVKLVGLSLDDNAADDYKVTATCASPDGSSFEIKSKYIVGSDGGSSAVRKLGEIPFIGADKEDHWVRIDGVVKTNMPDSRVGLGAIESKTHGQVLWVALDHGATRIGYVLTPEMYAKYGRNMKQEDAIKEAQAAMAPFELEFLQVDWHTVYSVKQHVAERLQDRERILLAGDAAHVHSSGSAQGMNTGTHDAVCLGWRLAGVINGLYKPEVLLVYSNERKAVAEQLIENDKVIAAYISGKRPEKFKHRSEDMMVLLEEFLRDQQGFSFGLGITYASNLLNDVKGSYPPISPIPGYRAPDVLLHKHGFTGMCAPIRLYEVMKNHGQFYILVFTGDARDTRHSLRTLRGQVDELSPKFRQAITFRTIIVGTAPAIEEHLGVRQFGDAYWDLDRTAHWHWKVSIEAGAIAVVRPDCILGFVAPLDRFEKVAGYLSHIVVPQEQPKGVTNGPNGVGEIISPDENNLFYRQSNAQDVPESLEQGAVCSR